MGIGVGAAVAFLTTTVLAVSIVGSFDTSGITANSVVSASVIKNNFDALSNTIQGLPDCTEASAMLTEAGTQTLSSTVAATLTNVTEVYDSTGLHAAGTPGRFTIAKAGRYYVSAFVYFQPNGTGSRFAGITLNNFTTIVSAMETSATVGGATQFSLSGMINANVGDFVLIRAQQDSGANLDVQQVRFSIFRICGD